MDEVKDAALWTLVTIGMFFEWLWFGLVAFWDWAKAFWVVKDVSSFFFPKIAIVVLGKLVTPFPLWVLLPLSFVPPPAVGLIYFLTIIIVLKQ